MENKAVIFVSMVLACFLTGNCLGQMPTVLSFVADPAKICIGQGINLSWQVDNAENISIEPDLNIVDAMGSRNIFPRNNTTYKLTASNANGNITAELGVVVTDCIAIENFIAEPQEVCKGSNATLQWNVVGASNVTIDHDIGEVPSTGLIEVTGNENTTYNITATNDTRISTTNTSVIVDLSCPSIEYFEVDMPDIIKGSNATLSWNVTNAANISLDNGIGEADLLGSIQVSPDSSIIYRLNATNGTNFETSEIIINVSTKLPDVVDFAANPSMVVKGTNSTLSWNVTGADFVSIDPNIGKVTGNGTQDVIMEDSTTYILTAGNASGNVTETATVNVDNIAYDFIARAPYADWHAEIDGEEYGFKFPVQEAERHGYAKYGNTENSILKIGPRSEGRIIGDFTKDMIEMGYFIDPRDKLSFWADLSDSDIFSAWDLNPLSDVIVNPMLGSSSLRSYGIHSYQRSVTEHISLEENAGEMPRFYLVVDCNGRDYGDDIFVKEMRIIRE